jgi:hypothetical protein
MLWLLGLACAPGKIEVGTGSDELHTALYVTIPDEGDQRRAALLLSNSKLRCDARAVDFVGVVDTGFDTGDFDTALNLPTRASVSEELAIALTRENSRIVLIELMSFRQEDWTGYYPLNEDASASLLDDLNPRVGIGTYYGVNEAEADVDDGLLRSYDVTDLDFATNIGAPGQVEITRSRKGDLWGSFNMDQVNVSGRFRAEQCDVAYEDSVIRVFENLLSFNAF